MARPPLWKLTPEQKREASYDEYLALTEKYNAAIEADGDTPWHDNDPEKRKALWLQRFRPQGATDSVPRLTLDEIRRSNN